MREFVTIVFPLLFIFVEYCLRTKVGNAEASAFITPALASGGLALLFPCVTPRNLVKHISQPVGATASILIIYSRDELFVTGVSRILLFLFSLGWLGLIYVSITQASSGLDATLWCCRALYFAVAIYALSAAVAEAKEWL